ncbi:MAG: aminotransferase class V-fold PLP-dependent enzyme [Paludibacteraceae bacterium]|nr:aminotransferase class V-fold PLP-dependent enzyme [Paludibacteraceae bacterium]
MNNRDFIRQAPVSFTCDYNEGAHPEILRRLLETNMLQEPGYGSDRFTQSAIAKIRQATCCPNADVVFLVGGTQTNATVIDGLLPRFGAVIAVETGHIAVHESGAIEHTGHKVITLPQHEGKMHAEELRNYLIRFFADDTWQHMANPKMVYLSFPTEYGTIYSHRELEEIYGICREYDLLLFVDGARLGYGLASPAADIDLPGLAQVCDVFYIGGTKVGALCGEAVVFPRGNAPQPLLTVVKQHGALLAKGRLLGIQFDTLFTDDLYLRISRHAIDAAMRLQLLFRDKQIPLYIQSPTNQQFPILTQEQMKRLEGKVLYEIWERLSDGRAVTRFATSWATPAEHIQLLAEIL